MEREEKGGRIRACYLVSEADFFNHQGKKDRFGEAWRGAGILKLLCITCLRLHRNYTILPSISFPAELPREGFLPSYISESIWCDLTAPRQGFDQSCLPAQNVSFRRFSQKQPTSFPPSITSFRVCDSQKTYPVVPQQLNIISARGIPGAREAGLILSVAREFQLAQYASSLLHVLFVKLYTQLFHYYSLLLLKLDHVLCL